MQKITRNRRQPVDDRPSNYARTVSWLLLLFGVIALLSSIIFASTILAFVGLGLTLWGTLFLYMSPERYVKQTLLDSTLLSSLTDLDQILSALKYEGACVYLPPKHLRDFGTTKIFLPKNPDTPLPTPEEIRKQDDKLFLTHPEAVLITPPGQALANLFEKRLGTSFTKVDVEYLRQQLPRLFTENLEIAENLEIEHTSGRDDKEEYDTIEVKITNSVYHDICRETSSVSINGIGCPICSAIACALAKATGTPVTIEKTQWPANEKTIHVTFRVGKTEPKERIKALPEVTIEVPAPLRARTQPIPAPLRTRVQPSVSPNLSVIPMAWGIMLLILVGWVTWYDLLVWSKDVGAIFFGSRTGQIIGLGIGLTLLHYLLIGLALLILGVLSYFRRRGHG